MNIYTKYCILVKKIKQKIIKYRYSVIFPAFVASFFANFLFLIHGYTSPDGLCEGMIDYTGALWALSIGRWAIYFLNFATLNIVMPFFNVMISVLCCSIVTILLAELWNIQKKGCLCITAVSITIAPAIIAQYLYIYMDLAFSLALLFSSLSAYCILHFHGKKSFIGAILLLATGLGGYQSYIGFTAAIIILTLLLRLIRGMTFREFFHQLQRSLAMGILGCLLYITILKINFLIFNVQMSSYSGADKIGILNTLTRLPESFVNIYIDFFEYYTINTAHRNVWFVLLLSITVLILVLRIGKLIYQKNFKEAFTALFCIIVLPISMNLVVLIVPDHSTSVLMSHQMQLLIPFALTLLQPDSNYIFEKVSTICITVLSGIICWNCLLVAYATHYSVGFSYQYTETLSRNILAQVQNMEGYTPDTRILYAGIPDEEAIQKNNPIYKYSMQHPSVFWNDEYGLLTCWPNFNKYYLAVDTGVFTKEEYHNVLDSAEFQNMPCYPSSGAIQFIGNDIVVKLQELPPRT